MADRYDPKLSLRSVSDRKGADPRRDRPGEDDPLAELAKIVSGRTGGSARTRAPANDPAANASGGDVLGDLETELLNDLQASFAAVRDMVATPPPAPAKPVHSDPLPPPAPVPTPAPIEPPSDALAESSESDLPPAGMAEKLAPEPPVTPFEFSLTGRIAEPKQPDRRRSDEATGQTDRPPRTDAARSRATHQAGDFGTFRSRLSEATPTESPVEPKQPRTRWERPEPPKPSPSTVSRFAPPRTAAQPPRVPVAPADDDDFDPLADLIAEDDGAPDDFPLEGFGELQSDDEDDDEATFPQGDLASMIEPRRSRTPLLIASVIGLVLIGGVGVAMFRPTSTEGETPPVIVADGLPTKITPEETAVADADTQNKLIYDRVDAGEGNAETTLLTPNDEPIAAVPADDAGDNAITRVIIPAGPGFDDPAADEGLSLDGQPSTMPPESAQVAAVETDEPIQAIGPRRVRTVVVKPDGTIVESAASEVDAPPDIGQGTGTATVAAPPVEPEPLPVPATVPAPAPITDDTAAIAGTGNGELAITPVPEIGGAPMFDDDPPQQAAAAPQQTAPAPPPVPQPEPAPAPATVTASANPAAPIDLSQSPPPSSGGMLVQVSSQRSEDAARATFRDLQTRYPSILGPYDVNIQRADIPDRGIFYRVRVGPFSASDAQRLCNDLKSAGGDCILAQR